MKKHAMLLTLGCLTAITISGRSVQDLFFPEISKLGELNLINKNLDSLDGLQNISDKKRIKCLYLGNNQLEKLPPNIFKGFTNLTWLSLDGNKLKTLPAVIFKDLKKLKILSLNRNPLRNGEKEKISAEVKKSAPACTIFF